MLRRRVDLCRLIVQSDCGDKFAIGSSAALVLDTMARRTAVVRREVTPEARESHPTTHVLRNENPSLALAIGDPGEVPPIYDRIGDPPSRDGEQSETCDQRKARREGGPTAIERLRVLSDGIHFR